LVPFNLTLTVATMSQVPQSNNFNTHLKLNKHHVRSCPHQPRRSCSTTLLSLIVQTFQVVVEDVNRSGTDLVTPSSVVQPQSCTLSSHSCGLSLPVLAAQVGFSNCESPEYSVVRSSLWLGSGLDPQLLKPPEGSHFSPEEATPCVPKDRAIRNEHGMGVWPSLPDMESCTGVHHWLTD
jgi:hypothetical protein